MTLQKLPSPGHSGTFGGAFCANIFSSLCTLSAYYLKDNAIFATVLLGLSSESYFLGDFWKISRRPSFALSQKKQVLGDVAKIAITWPFGHFWRRFLRQNLLQSLHFKCIIIRRQSHLHQSAVRPFEQWLLFGGFLKNFLWSPLCTFSENASFGWRCENCHNLAIQALLDRGLRQSLLLLVCYLHQSAFVLSNGGYFLGDFWNISLNPPFALFQKMRVLGYLAKIAITWPFGHFWSRCLRQNLFQSLHYSSIQIRG